MPLRRLLPRITALVFAGAALVAAVPSCANMPVIGGLFSIDSTQAVATAERNVCGHTIVPPDSTCVLRGFAHPDGHYVVVLDRHPPAGNDRVAVTVSKNGGQVIVAPVDTAAAPDRR